MHTLNAPLITDITHRLCVCQIVAEPYNAGGLEKHFIELSRELSHLCELHVIAHDRYKKYFASTIQFHSIDLSQARNNPLFLLKMTRLINQIQPDIVHAHAKKAGQMLGVISHFTPVITVATIHNQTAAKWWMRSLDKLVCVSSTIQQALSGLPTQVIYNGIAYSEPTFTYTLPDSYKNVVAVGTLVARKGFKTLIEACHKLPVNLHIVGEGPDMAQLRRQAELLGCSNQVFFHGYRDDVMEILAAADLTVIASQREGFSYVFAESLFVKTPVISTRVPVACEILDADYLVPVDDSQALQEKIEECLQNPEKLSHDFSKWYALAREAFTIEKMIFNTLSLYRELFHTSGQSNTYNQRSVLNKAPDIFRFFS